MTIGQSMRKIREDKGYSRQKLENESGVPFNSIIKWERDAHLPNILALIDIADALGVTLDELVGRDFESENKRLKAVLRQLRDILDDDM